MEPKELQPQAWMEFQGTFKDVIEQMQSFLKKMLQHYGYEGKTQKDLEKEQKGLIVLR
jgi:hypothetical protein